MDPQPHKTLAFGKHQGLLLTRVPISYLKWMVKNQTVQHADAQEELDRRGIPLDGFKVEVSGHALDRASTKCWGFYKMHRKTDEEGLWSWLHREAELALAQGQMPPDKPDIRYWQNMKWVFNHQAAVPVLMTVMPKTMTTPIS